MKLSSILVPLKGTPLDDEVLQLAFLLAAPTGDRRPKQRVQVEVIHIVEVPQALPLDAELPEAVQQGEAVLTHAEEVARQRDIEIHPEMLQARHAGTAIVDEAVERGADLIIMGYEYRRRHGEFTSGATAPYVLKNAPCRVWLVRGPRPEPEPGK